MAAMHLDTKLTTGILLGAIMGLKYHDTLLLYLPILVIITVIMLLKTVREAK